VLKSAELANLILAANQTNPEGLSALNFVDKSLVKRKNVSDLFSGRAAGIKWNKFIFPVRLPCNSTIMRAFFGIWFLLS